MLRLYIPRFLFNLLYSVTYTSGETVWSERFAKIREVLQNKDVYEPIDVNEFIQANNRTMFMTIIKHTIERGLPFQLKEYSISYYKLPSVGSHSAVHVEKINK